jgi:glycosyltransferase involved in cell wall biosynthesis
LKNYGDKNVIYAGFVDDVVPYFKAADIFLNPITTGGGIKTKVVEAIGYGTTVISCKTGSAGINVAVCGEKIQIVPDNDANAFARAIFGVSGTKIATPQAYYEYYYWGNIIKRIQAVFDQ